MLELQTVGGKQSPFFPNDRGLKLLLNQTDPLALGQQSQSTDTGLW